MSKRSRWYPWIPAILVVCVSLTEAALADPGATGQEFVTALQRVRQHQADLPDSAALANYAIYDYLVAARLRRDLATTVDDGLDGKIDDFLNTRGSQPVTRNLRREWLASLADRGRWDLFLPRSVDVSDPALICDRMAGRLATDDTQGLADEALFHWSVPQKPPEQCSSVYSWLRSKGLLTAARSEARVRAALAADTPRLARDFLIDIPPERAAPLLQWAQLLESPKAAVAVLAISPTTPVEADALIAGFNKLSFSDSAAAASLLPHLLKRPSLTAAQRSRLQRSAALGEASSRTPGAVAAFALVPEEASDGPVQEWRVRAALWAGDFAKALMWLEQMPPTLASQPRWRYWHARAVAATSGESLAAPLYAEIAGLRDYYGYLAADRLKQSYHLNVHASPDDADAQAALASEAGLKRAHALFDCDLADDAGAEWTAVLTGATPATKVQAAHLASRWGWYAQTSATLAQAGEWDDVALRYPRPYAAAVADASEESDVPGDWIFGIMRQESLFRKDAVSRADARGLMQMLPATAISVARRWHLPAPTRDTLFDPPIAVRFGALYVRELLDRYKGQLELTLAAYNAGPISVARWMPGNPIDADIWIENIPYNETRGYVEHILEHIVAFAAMRDAEPPRLSTLLTQIELPPSTPP